MTCADSRAVGPSPVSVHTNRRGFPHCYIRPRDLCVLALALGTWRKSGKAEKNGNKQTNKHASKVKDLAHAAEQVLLFGRRGGEMFIEMNKSIEQGLNLSRS